MKDESGEYGRGEHLGKRSAAGLYCYACDVSLVTGVPGGKDVRNPHTVKEKARGLCVQCAEVCPRCAAKPPGNFFLPELFTPTKEQVKQEEAYCVRYSCSFGFAQSPEQIAAYAPDVPVINEYEETLSMDEFRTDVIGTAKFLFTHFVGHEFS